jgi:12,18-didecarboxysiroheme deacetylase
MIGISKLYCGTVEPSDALRYGRHSKHLPSHLLQFSADKKPVVVYNVTRGCNLQCMHCYSHSHTGVTSDDMSTVQAKAMLDDLAQFGVPVVLFSGGEPLTRPDLLQLIEHAVGRGMRAVISTNGTLITPQLAAEFKRIGLSYVGISIDGKRDRHDAFRRTPGAFDAAMAGIAACQEAGVKVGLRFTITKVNHADIPGVFDLLQERAIPRICFYHLVYSGRGAALQKDALSHEQTRAIVDDLISRTKALHQSGHPAEVLTVDNHCDGPYLYLRMLQEQDPRADAVMELLQMNGGNSSGVGIGCVSWDGEVHPDQFWRHTSLGNVQKRPFSEIWTDRSNELMDKLKEKSKHVKGRCAQCRFLNICGGNFRVRAEAVYGDVWAQEPDCYLTDKEIGLE